MKINKSIQFIGRIIAASIILGITAFFSPGFTMSNIWIVISAVFILSIVDFILGISILFKHPIIKLFLGLILCLVVLYSMQYFIVGYILSFIPIFLGALLYGLVDYMLPNKYQNS